MRRRVIGAFIFAADDTLHDIPHASMSHLS